MNKQGQVTLFIIIAIVILGSAVIYFAFRNSLSNSADNSFQEAETVKTFTESCIQKTGIDVIYEVGLGGGYYFPPKDSTESGIVYYYDSANISNFPSLSFVEDQISLYISENIPLCTKNFVLFENVNVSSGTIDVKTSIENDKVILNLNYPIKISKGNQTSIVSEFKNVEIPIRLGTIYNSVGEISDYSYENSGKICLSCILNVSEKNNLNVSMIDYENSSTIFIISDKNSNAKNGTDFMWLFANKYKKV